MDIRQRVLTVNEAAMFAGVHPDTIRNWIKKKYLKPIRKIRNVWILDAEEVIVAKRKAAIHVRKPAVDLKAKIEW